jgi:hypothetical protein
VTPKSPPGPLRARAAVPAGLPRGRQTHRCPREAQASAEEGRSAARRLPGCRAARAARHHRPALPGGQQPATDLPPRTATALNLTAHAGSPALRQQSTCHRSLAGWRGASSTGPARPVTGRAGLRRPRYEVRAGSRASAAGAVWSQSNLFCGNAGGQVPVTCRLACWTLRSLAVSITPGGTRPARFFPGPCTSTPGNTAQRETHPAGRASAAPRPGDVRAEPREGLGERLADRSTGVGARARCRT